jgi:acyl carrier protein
MARRFVRWAAFDDPISPLFLLSIPEFVMYQEQVRNIVAQHARLSADISQLTDSSDLYAAGLTSLTTVNLMLAIEDHFDIEFPDKMLGRKTFESIQSLSEAIEEILN